MELGSAADWAAGVGSLAAVICALLIAFRQEREFNKRRRDEQEQAEQRRIHLIDEVIRVASHVEVTIEWISNPVGLEPTQSLWQFYLVTLAGYRGQFEALQSLARDDPRVFSEIGRLISECDFMVRLEGGDWMAAATTAANLKKLFSYRREQLEKIKHDA
ncbi:MULTISPECIES: hypothetical protein [unclassified Sphingobium]|uniref:hypothetical protein n=1 Tax=unclassified Sphingobium TaxID=2611147 RepID=UPI0022247BA5|nr:MULTISPECIES: hypothetical protein [unclassified Sphingobium]MCW2411993.1 hypothetical protein [Sphingobium sp. B8D3D]MCW2415709.1 hypothetical protein [Sphingobium sp. B8D3A]